MKPEISIVIPTYNANKTLAKCLDSIDYENILEVLVIDDCSTDNTIEIAKEFDCRIAKLKENSGPAKARNAGVKLAKGNIILFVDSDIILKEDAVKKTIEFYEHNPDEVCVIGMYAKEPANKTWFNHYISFWKYYTWAMPAPKYFTFFIASIGSIKKEVFSEIGGFNEKYKGADVEDYEFGYKLTQKYKIPLSVEIQGLHHFPTFKSCVKNYFKRTSQWFSVFMKRKKFDSGQAKGSTGLSFVLSAMVIPLLILSLFFSWVAYIALGFFLVFLLIGRKFYFLCLKQKGIVFFLYSIIVSYALSLVIFTGVLRSVLNYVLRR